MQLIANQRILDLSFTHVMGILNITNDSFFDGGKYQQLSAAIDQAAIMLRDGATIIDVGGESARPGAKIILEEEEVNRVIPVIEALSKRFDTFISIDTSKSLVIKEAAAAGANMINDIRALSDPNSMIEAAKSQLLVCLMHMQGEPDTMQRQPYYKNILADIKSFFIHKIACCKTAGIDKHRILIDPGFGFGKTLSHNYNLLANLKYFNCLGLPILVGMSRKSMISNLMNISPKESLAGSIACAIIAAIQGVKIIRVHDVKPTVEALRVFKETIAYKKLLL